MKFFTQDMYRRCRSADEDVVDAASAEWEQANEAYAAHLDRITPLLTPGAREMAGLLLHDASVRSMGRNGGRLLMALQKDIPPRDLVLLDYNLAGEPQVEAYGERPRPWEAPTDFQFDELDVAQEDGETMFTQSIVLGNGWLLRLRFRDVCVTVAHPLAFPGVPPVPAMASA
jgi:hypothetical protein